MPMELLFALAQSQLPTTVDSPADIDRLRVLAAADLVKASLPDVDSSIQRAEVTAISFQGQAALAKAYPGHPFTFRTHVLPGPVLPEWLAPLDASRVDRKSTKTTLDS
ncbi:MAG: hypothetical protein EON49_14290 [Acidovorax sp.]|nr:MAG: hypothetical protein EON49_14290 [Acidovorax sp.]